MGGIKQAVGFGSVMIVAVAMAATACPASGGTARVVAYGACARHITPESDSPCKVGDIFVECGYRFGACENDRGTRYFKCKISRELGKVVKVVEDEKEGLEGTRIENPHKTVTCKGTATVLAAYVTNGKRASLGGFKAIGHGTHTVTVTLYLRKDFPGLDVLAQQ